MSVSDGTMICIGHLFISSIVCSGPAPNFLSPWAYEYLVGGIENTVLHPESCSQKFQQIHQAKNVEELRKMLCCDEGIDLLDSIGFQRNPATVTMNDQQLVLRLTNGVDMLSKTEMLAPAYFIVGGTKSGEATVITRSRQKAIDTWKMDKSKGEWFLLETNYDHWKKPLFIDDRRTPGNKCMNEVTQKGMGLKGLFNVLSTKPNLNKLTTYTALMQVDAGSLDTYLQDCPDPCWPW
ncbi:acid ceramidase-like [Clytia hemisphaerica]